jgi:rare lipoprotein A
MLRKAVLFTLVPLFTTGFVYDDPTPTMLASYYATGETTANGEAFDPTALTAAHRALPFGTMLKLRNIANQREVVVRINDRGPYVEGRSLDLTLGAAEQLGMVETGLAEVTFTVVMEVSGAASARSLELISSR